MHLLSSKYCLNGLNYNSIFFVTYFFSLRLKTENEIFNLINKIMQEVIMMLIVFGALFGTYYLYISSRHKERMALIEKGADASLFAKPLKVKPTSVLKWGMFFAGLAIGALIGNVIAEYTALEEPVAYLSMILLFGGLSLVGFYLVEKKISKENKE